MSSSLFYIQIKQRDLSNLIINMKNESYVKMQISYLDKSKLLWVLKIKKCDIIRVEYGKLLFEGEKNFSIHNFY
mgnify:CR=1 FL=1